MPRFDRMGPFEAGPMTGRGFGPCGLGIGWHRGFGFGKGLGKYFGWSWPSDPKQTRQDLKDYKQALKEELENVEKEEKELEVKK